MASFNPYTGEPLNPFLKNQADYAEHEKPQLNNKNLNKFDQKTELDPRSSKYVDDILDYPLRGNQLLNKDAAEEEYKQIKSRVGKSDYDAKSLIKDLNLPQVDPRDDEILRGVPDQLKPLA